VEQVRHLVVEQLHRGVASSEAIARRLGMSERTLQRRLSDNDVTFSSVVDEVRRCLARALSGRTGHEHRRGSLRARLRRSTELLSRAPPLDRHDTGSRALPRPARPAARSRRMTQDPLLGHHARCHLGLVPREHSSVEKQQRGHITKARNSRVRSLLVECAWGILRRRNPQCEPLEQWALRIAARRGERSGGTRAQARRHLVRDDQARTRL
jgi:transposase